jgi:3-hydroxyacyl-[acyl-carrier-protein] dehydratase
MTDTEKIKEMIPHRDPFLFIDSIVELDADHIVAQKHIDGTEEFFRGHYPGNPILPGVIICESMLQAGALVMSEKMEHASGVPVVTRVDNLKFKKMVKPGDTMCIEVNFLEQMSVAYYFKGKVKVNNKVCSSCDFVCTVASGE